METLAGTREGRCRTVFVLLPGFSLLAYASALDPLRLANRIAGGERFAWRSAARDGSAVSCSAGTCLAPDDDLSDLGPDDTILVCAGEAEDGGPDRKLIGWLRRQARRVRAVGGVCGGSRIMAQAGLLEGRRAAVHGDVLDSFAEVFPDVEVSRTACALDGNRLTAASPSGAADLVLRLIARDAGEDLARAVAARMRHSGAGAGGTMPRMEDPAGAGIHHPRLAEVIARMETHIEEPISPTVLARDVGLSTRQLERLFRRHLNRSPKRYYMELRLQKARTLLLQSDMSVISVALACGFTSPSHFSKCYRGRFEITPYRERGARGLRSVPLDAFQIPEPAGEWRGEAAAMK